MVGRGPCRRKSPIGFEMRSAPRVYRWTRRTCALGGCLALLGGCVLPPAAPSSAPGPRQRLGSQEVQIVARLLQLEDTRLFAEAELRDAAMSQSPEVRTRAALAIGRLQQPQGIPLLAGLINDPDTSVAATAAFSLGLIGDSSAVTMLVPLLTDSAGRGRPTVVAEAVYALGKLRSSAAHSALSAFLSTSPVASAPVGSALLAIWRFPLSADVTPIMRWTSAPDPDIRWRAAYALTRRPTPAATRALLQLATDTDARVRAAALRGLTAPLADASGVGAAAALPIVLTAAADSSYPVRIAAIRALAGYSDPRAVQRLVSLLQGGDRHAALASLESLAEIGPAAAEAGSTLLALAEEDSVPVAIRQGALVALAAVAPALAAQAAHQWSTSSAWRLRAAAGCVLVLADAPYAGALNRLLRDPDGRVAAAALEAMLQRAGDSAASLRSVLIESLGSPDVWVRTTALGGLGRLRDPATLPLILEAYQRAAGDTVNDAALAAIDALAALAGDGALPQRAFFARFTRSADYLIRLRAQQRFGASADSAWGEPYPIETARSLPEYRALVERWISPALEPSEDPQLEISTDAGRIRLRLFAADAPLTIESMLRLAETGYFDGQEWPRVVPNFVVQGGDPRGDTNGGPGYALRDEINRHRYEPGSLGMALSGPDTGGSQFFVTHSSQPHLDGIYTVWGKVVEGQEVTEAILPGDRIRFIRILR